MAEVWTSKHIFTKISAENTCSNSLDVNAELEKVHSDRTSTRSISKTGRFKVIESYGIQCKSQKINKTLYRTTNYYPKIGLS